MRIPSILLASLLLLSTMFLASAKTGNKTYDIHLYSPAVAGTTQLPAGEYKVSVEGSNAVIKGVDNHESFNVPATVQTSDKKFGDTAVITTDRNGATHLEAIEVGGSTTRINFGE
jgi:hypothetical protein